MRTVDDLVAAFEARTLPKAEWTHEAHVVVCWSTVARLGGDAALAHLRTAIPRYNVATGTPNSDTDGYHDTITVYYVAAVTALAGAPLDEVIAHPSCSRAAPLAYWSREQLFSVPARRGWVEPDLQPLPW
ncbi:MAG: hypothetical protein RL238_1668 [Actinomycetota bacterium]|jgi:hypothetical protein